ncbi:MAG: aminoglycoside adenylyltransferase domain-containing protein [Actinomycetota bacterium]
MTPVPDLPQPVVDAIARWLARHDELVPGLIDGLYVVGSAALGDWRPGSDVDVIAFTSREVVADDVVALTSAHETAATDNPGVDVDGPRLEWTDVTTGPQRLVRPWSLADEFHHDDQCFECHPVTWRTLARHGVVVRGPAVAELEVFDDDSAVCDFVRENTNSYWRGVADQIEQALATSPDRDEFDASTVSWCALGIARMLVTARTGDVVSKTEAGRRTIDQFATDRALLERAIDIRHGQSTNPVDRPMMGDTVRFVREVADEVEATVCA